MRKPRGTVAVRVLALALLLAVTRTAAGGAVAAAAAPPVRSSPTPREPGPSMEAERGGASNAGRDEGRAGAGIPPTTAADWWSRNPSRLLQPGTPEDAGMIGAYLDRIDGAVRTGIEAGVFPGAVVLVARHGRIVKHQAYGHALKYATDREPLPPSAWLPMRPDTVFDLASVTKLFTSIAVMQLAERARIDLDDPVAKYVPEFGLAGKDFVTVRQLLAHTSGLPAWRPLYTWPGTPADRLRAVLETPLTDPPGTVYRYSDLGMIVLGVLVERVSGLPLDRYIAEHITEPLGMRDTMFNPPASLRERIAATEYQPWTNRSLVWGSVHDENAHALGGVAGHAGLFSTARDLAVLAQALLNGGRYGNARILKPQTVSAMMVNQLPEMLGNDHGLGWELNQGWYMDALASPFTAGHTGYTGTSLVIDPRSETVVVLLTNRVHPTRNGGSVNPWRRQVARLVARSLPVRPWSGQRAWYGGMGDGVEHTLQRTIPVDGPATLRFHTWFDLEEGFDFGYVEISLDGGQHWEPLRGRLKVPPSTGAGAIGGASVAVEGVLTGSSAGRWLEAELDLPPARGWVTLRFRYVTDASVNGRGWYVDEVVVVGQTGMIWRDRGDTEAGWTAKGWTLSTD
ncbi:MAG: serine hydrolase [Bacillota bacterium]|nr:MAG: serine hydrolase [Bacillota bacterium]